MPNNFGFDPCAAPCGAAFSEPTYCCKYFRGATGPQGAFTTRKAALALLKTADLGHQLGIRKKMLKAALNPLVLQKVVFQK